jgi:PilZ domain-containing protein
MYGERRRAPRVEVLGRMQGRLLSANAPVVVREVSLGGLSFSSPVQFPIGEIHEFRLTLGDDSSVELRGKIVRAEARANEDGSTDFITGVQFIEDESGGDGSMGDLIGKMK